jgi:hypothetical protein
MREIADSDAVKRLIEELGRRTRGGGVVYLVGGATALLLGIRQTTVDIDLKLDPEPVGVFEAIRDLKEQLQVNIELASPDQFVPALPGWGERSDLIAVHNGVQFRNFDLYTQTLAKLERGYERDMEDVRAFIRLGLVVPGRLRELFESVRGQFIRYPSVDLARLEARLRSLEEVG